MIFMIFAVLQTTFLCAHITRTPLRSVYGVTHPLAEARCIALQANAMPYHRAAL